MNNTTYQDLRDFVKEHHGFSGKDFEEHPEIMKNYKATMDEIRKFNGQRVKLSFRASTDFMGASGEKIGRIKIDDGKDTIKFYEGRKRTRHYYLDAGLFDGWFATLIPLKIEKV